MFVNISNHPSARWSTEQRNAALGLGGDIRDIQFPNVPPTASMNEVGRLAEDLASQVEPGSVVMVQGEFSLTFMLTRRLIGRGCRVVVACTERTVQERELEGGKVEKTAVFEFVQFRPVWR